MKQFLVILFSFIITNPYIGIDISHHNNINWDEINDLNVEFCYIKLTEGKHFIDSKAQDHFLNSKKRNIKTGFYHYFRTNVSGKDQLDLFKNQLNNFNYELIPVIDIENTGNDFSDLTKIKKEISDFIEGFKNEFGYYPIIYYGNLNAFRLLSVTRKCKSWIRVVGIPKFLCNFNLQQVKIEQCSFGELDINYCNDISRILVRD